MTDAGLLNEFETLLRREFPNDIEIDETDPITIWGDNLDWTNTDAIESFLREAVRGEAITREAIFKTYWDDKAGDGIRIEILNFAETRPRRVEPV